MTDNPIRVSSIDPEILAAVEANGDLLDEDYHRAQSEVEDYPFPLCLNPHD